jgi:predicted hydrocarbon binding protein
MNERRALNYFRHPDFPRLDVRAGVLRSRGGTRFVAVNDDFLRGFVAACEHEAGPAAALVLRRCGEFFGARLARRFESELGQFAGQSLRDRSMAEFDELLRDMWRGCGYGDLRVDWSRGERGFLAVRLIESPMQDIGPSGHTGDDLFCGVLAGFFNEFCDADVRCVQTGDARLGDRDGTTFIVAPFEIAKRAEGMRANKIRHGEIVESLGV